MALSVYASYFQRPQIATCHFENKPAIIVNFFRAAKSLHSMLCVNTDTFDASWCKNKFFIKGVIFCLVLGNFLTYCSKTFYEVCHSSVWTENHLTGKIKVRT